MELAIRTEHLTKIYAGRVIAVNDLRLEVPQGAVYGLLGPNGAGRRPRCASCWGCSGRRRGGRRCSGGPVASMRRECGG